MSLDKLNDNARRSAQARFSDASVLHAARKPHPEGVSPHFCRREIRRREGLLATDAWGSFVCSAGDGECKRAAEATVPINDKMIVLGLQAHNHWGGLISYFNADRGGQAYAYKPELP